MKVPMAEQSKRTPTLFDWLSFPLLFAIGSCGYDVVKELRSEAPFDVSNVGMLGAIFSVACFSFVLASRSEVIRSHLGERRPLPMWTVPLLPLACLGLDTLCVFWLNLEGRGIELAMSCVFCALCFVLDRKEFFFLRRWWPLKGP